METTKEDIINNKIMRVKAKKIRRQFKTFIAYAFLMALITSNGFESDNFIMKIIFSVLIVVCLIFILLNMTKWLKMSSKEDYLRNQLHEKD